MLNKTQNCKTNSNLMIKIIETSFTQRFDDSMSSFSSERRINDMESSKRCVKLVSLIFIIRYLTKSNIILIYLTILG